MDFVSVVALSVRTAWSCSNGCKSRARPDGGKRIAKSKGIVVTRCLKEAGGKSLA